LPLVVPAIFAANATGIGQVSAVTGLKNALLPFLTDVAAILSEYG
jgi:hypothetical protein